MIRLICALLALIAFLAPAAPAREMHELSILYLSRADDPAYKPHPVYTGLSLRDRQPPVDGARLAVRGGRIRGRGLGVRFTLEERALADGESAVAAVQEAAPRAVILDLPLPEMEAVVAALGNRSDLILFNIRHTDDHLRRDHCAPALLHTIPSRAMLADAMAQYLALRDWHRVLLLAGEDAASRADGAAFERAAHKFGLTIVDSRRFELTNDPRRRERSNIALLTGGVEHDIIYLADAIGEFGRYVPYATYAPRPVVGSEGLRAETWHWTLERYGAPQLNQRFERRTGRKMGGEDWAAWAAVRAVIEAVVRTKSLKIAELRRYMQTDSFSLDLYKGFPGSFRRWSGQLRQPILLARHNAVIAVAPFDKFLHQTNVLDTLGLDRPEAACSARK